MVEVDLLVGASGDAHTPTAAGILVNQNNAIFLTLVHRARGAGRHTGGVQAVVADTRQVEHEGFFDARLNQRLHLGQRRVLVHGLKRTTQVVVPVRAPLDGIDGLTGHLRARTGRRHCLRSSGRGQQAIVIVCPRLVVVVDLRHVGVCEDRCELLQTPTAARNELAGLGQAPSALPAFLIFPSAGIANTRAGLNVVEPHVLGTFAVRPRLLTRHRTGVAANALVKVHHHDNLTHDLHRFIPSLHVWGRTLRTPHPGYGDGSK